MPSLGSSRTSLARSNGPQGFRKFHYLNRIKKAGILSVIIELEKEYGDFIDFKVPTGPSLCFVFGPTDITAVLQKEAKKFIKGKAVAPFKLLVGNGLSVTEHDTWLNQRRMVQPSFHLRSIEELLSYHD